MTENKIEDLDFYSIANTDIQKITTIREARDSILKMSDKYLIPDYPITIEKKQEWINYRQQLRDITVDLTLPEDLMVFSINQTTGEIINTQGKISWPLPPSP